MLEKDQPSLEFIDRRSCSTWLSLTYSSDHNTLEIHQFCLKWQCFIHYGWLIIHWVYMCVCFFFHLSVILHLSSFHILITVSIGLIYLFDLMFLFSSYKYPEVELLNHMVVLFLIFWGTSILFSRLPWWLRQKRIHLQCRRLRLWRSPGEQNGYPTQYSCLENSMDLHIVFHSGCSSLHFHSVGWSPFPYILINTCF